MQKQSHRHLREEDRKIIYRMSKAGKTQQEIAEVLGVCQATISKELRCNTGQRGYRPRQAQMKAVIPGIFAEIPLPVERTHYVKPIHDLHDFAVFLGGLGLAGGESVSVDS